MKILGSIFGLNFSAQGMSIQRKKMDLIAQNIANSDTIRTESGEPYKRKYLKVETQGNVFAKSLSIEGQQLQLNVTNENHITISQNPQEMSISGAVNNVKMNEEVDAKAGESIYMPDNPDANEKGFVQMSNVNVINEMVDMIAVTRGYEANLQSLNSTKQMVKDSLEI
jgi:flagellar basal-body rod protein FlgC